MIEYFARFHVVLVHLPIGILLLACVFQWMERRPVFSSLRLATNLAFLAGMVCAILSATTGYLLSRSGDYDEHLVSTHQWFGISVAIVSIAMYILHRRSASTATQRTASGLLFILIVITGHLGGSLTHGEGYLTKSLTSESDTVAMQRKPIPDVQEAMAYADVVQPILQTKCYSCHGKNKQKGKLRMDDSTRLMKGGKDGVVIVPGNAEKSEIVKRISLPRNDDDHMPPKEKPQLTAQDIALIHWWIASGAPFDKKVKEMEQPAEIKPALLALQKVQQTKVIVPEIPATPVSRAKNEDLQKLKDAGVVVEPVAQNTNYLSANFVTVPTWRNKQMDLLLPLKEQLVELKLAHTAIGDSALQVIAQCKNLMRLQLDHTAITDQGLGYLQSLKNLRYLNLVATRVTAPGVEQLKGLKNLQSIYLYQSGVKSSDWSSLRKMFPTAQLDSGGYTVPLFPTDTIEVKPPKTKQ